MNRTKLEVAMLERGKSNRELAKELNISEQAFYNKKSGKAEFKESEIRTLVSVLALSAADLNSIFFDQ